jgi:hypothetical protein
MHVSCRLRTRTIKSQTYITKHLVCVHKNCRSQYTPLNICQILGVVHKIDNRKGKELTEFVALKKSDLRPTEGILHKLRIFGIILDTFQKLAPLQAVWGDIKSLRCCFEDDSFLT